MNAPPISVVMPLYNNAAVVRRAIDSVLRQSVPRFELIIVNDGSTDGGDAIARQTGDGRVRVVDQANKGVSAARNRGIAEAGADLVAFLDADDEWKPDFLETIERLVHGYPDCAVFATHYFYRELDGSTRLPILRKVPQGDWEGILDDYFGVAASSDPPVWSSAVAVRKSALLSVGGFPEGIAIGEDLLTWARMATTYPIAYSTKPGAVFWLRAPLTGFPTRIPETPDRVGVELERLFDVLPLPRRRSFSRYMAMWHRMRASMFVQLGDRKNALADVKRMARYGATDPRVYIYGSMAIMPKMIRKFVLQFFTLVRAVRRKIER